MIGRGKRYTVEWNIGDQSNPPYAIVDRTVGYPIGYAHEEVNAVRIIEALERYDRSLREGSTDETA
jgi:hypothetical protein